MAYITDVLCIPSIAIRSSNDVRIQQRQNGNRTEWKTFFFISLKNWMFLNSV